MTTPDFSITLLVPQTPEKVFSAIRDVRGWWSEDIDGHTVQFDDEFVYHYKDIHACRIRLTEVIPYKKMEWLVLENYFSFTEDKNEWKNTRIIFEVSEKDNLTQLHFTHQGLTPEYECYEVCRDGWNNFINNSLYKLITTGKGQPNPKEGGFNEKQVEKWRLNS